MTSRFLSVITGLALCCSTACRAPEKPAATSGKPRVAFVLKTLNSPFFIEMQKGAVEAAAKQNVDLVIQAAEREVDAEKQMQIVENLLQTGIKVLLITPSGSREIVAVLAKVNAAGIPIVVIDDRIDAEGGREGGSEDRVLRRLGQRGRRPGRGACVGRDERRQGERCAA